MKHLTQDMVMARAYQNLAATVSMLARQYAEQGLTRAALIYQQQAAELYASVRNMMRVS